MGFRGPHASFGQIFFFFLAIFRLVTFWSPAQDKKAIKHNIKTTYSIFLSTKELNFNLKTIEK